MCNKDSGFKFLIFSLLKAQKYRTIGWIEEPYFDTIVLHIFYILISDIIDATISWKMHEDVKKLNQKNIILHFQNLFQVQNIIFHYATLFLKHSCFDETI